MPQPERAVDEILATVETRGSGPRRVVFVHGVLDRGRSFGRVAAALHDDCTMQWYDRRGYGASVDAPGAPTDVAGHIEDLLAVIGNEPAVLVAHSFGGVSAMGAALRAPHLVEAVAVYETGLAWLPTWQDTGLNAILFSPGAEEAGLRLMLGAERFDALSPQERDVRLRESAAFVTEERSVRLGAPPFDLSALRVPLVYGYGGHTVFTGVLPTLAELVPQVEIVEIPGAGHNAHRSHPAEVAQLVRRALALSASASSSQMR